MDVPYPVVWATLNSHSINRILGQGTSERIVLFQSHCGTLQDRTIMRSLSLQGLERHHLMKCLNTQLEGYPDVRDLSLGI